MDPEHPMKIDLPNNITIYPSQDREIDKTLKNLVKNCPAQFALLSEVSGQLISVMGERNKVDPVALASLIAGDMAASQEIAQIIGQYKHCQLIVREGTGSNILVTEAGDQLILFVQVDKNIPIGWARLMIVEASEKISEIIATTPNEEERVAFEIESNDLSGWVDDALNSLWQE